MSGEAINTRKIKKSIFRRWWFWVLTVLFIFILIVLFSGSSGPSSVYTSLTLEEMREQIMDVNYDDLARYPEKYKGKSVAFQGKVVQKVSDTEFRVNITKSEYDYWDDTVYLLLTKDVKDVRLLEDDVIEFLGLVQGELMYKAVLGHKITIPRIDAYEVGIVKE